MIEQLMHLDSKAFPSLNDQQKAQILRQIQYHVEAPPWEDLDLNGLLSLRLRILPGVTRPMSSKGLAKWLFRSSELYRNKNVLDIGTGCGIQGIVCLLGGAHSVLMTDIVQSATICTQMNLSESGLSQRAIVQQSDLFNSINDSARFDLIVFAQPYFSGKPIDTYEFTRGMLDPEGLLQRFFRDARTFLRRGGYLALMGWGFAGDGNEPALIGPQFGFKLAHTESYYDWKGVQQGEFRVVLLA